MEKLQGRLIVVLFRLTKKIAFGNNSITLACAPQGYAIFSGIGCFEILYHKLALVAQLVERVLGKDEVTGSIPVEGSLKEAKNGKGSFSAH